MPFPKIRQEKEEDELEGALRKAKCLPVGELNNPIPISSFLKMKRECLKLSVGNGSPPLQIRAVTVAAKIALIRSFTSSLLSVRSIIANMLPPLFTFRPV